MNSKVIIGFVFAGILIGALISFQVKSPVPVSSDFPADQIEAQRDLIKSFSDEQALLKSQLVSLREQIEQKQNSNLAVARTSNLETLENLKTKIGLTSISGPGVNILMDDSAKSDRDTTEVQADSLIHASDLRDIVNLLRTTKPEAIAINKQRIISTSPVSAVGNSILINNSRLLPPFQISVVGDEELIKQTFKTSPLIEKLLERKAKAGIIFELEGAAEHTIKLYNGDLTTNFLETTKEL